MDLCANKNIEQPISRRGGWAIPRGGLREGAPELRTEKSAKLTVVDDLDVQYVNNRNGMRSKCVGKELKRQTYKTKKPNFDWEEIDIEELPDIVPDWARTIKDDFAAEKEETEEFIALAEQFASCSTDSDVWEDIFPDLPLKRKRWLRGSAWNWTPPLEIKVEDNTELVSWWEQELNTEEEQVASRPGIKLVKRRVEVETDTAKVKKCKVNVENLAPFLTEEDWTRQHVQLVPYM